MAKSWMTIPLATMLCLMLALLSICILCSANENSSSNRKVRFGNSLLTRQCEGSGHKISVAMPQLLS